MSFVFMQLEAATAPMPHHCGAFLVVNWRQGHIEHALSCRSAAPNGAWYPRQPPLPLSSILHRIVQGGWGTENYIIPLGAGYIEIAAVWDPEAAQSCDWGRSVLRAWGAVSSNCMALSQAAANKTAACKCT